jgi:hypothetical protein
MSMLAFACRSRSELNQFSYSSVWRTSVAESLDHMGYGMRSLGVLASSLTRGCGKSSVTAPSLWGETRSKECLAESGSLSMEAS